MSARVTRRIVSVPGPFRLKGMDRDLPAGPYEIVIEEEAIGDFVYEAYRRTSTHLYVPPGPGDHGVGKFVATDPAELEKIMNTESLTA
jgi:hypothetical protein